jgi:hypothetical protein
MAETCGAWWEQGVGGQLAQGQTEQQRMDWYKLVYYLVEQDLNSGRHVTLCDT